MQQLVWLALLTPTYIQMHTQPPVPHAVKAINSVCVLVCAVVSTLDRQADSVRGVGVHTLCGVWISATVGSSEGFPRGGVHTVSLCFPL